jgi:hypothetical protein
MMRIRGIRRRFVVLSLMTLAAGCGSVHLGNGFGRRYHDAFSAQTRRDGAALSPFDAADAQKTMARRHGGGGTATPVSNGGGAGPETSGYPPASSAGIGADGNPNPIRLEAK